MDHSAFIHYTYFRGFLVVAYYSMVREVVDLLSIIMGWINDLHDSLSELVFNDGVVITQDIGVEFEALEQPTESSDTEIVIVCES